MKTWSVLHQELFLPKRLLHFLCETAGIIPENKISETANRNINMLVEALCRSRFQVQGKTTFKEEFVSCGGVDLKEVDFRTMQSRKLKGLYFAGEVLNIDGLTGGFNFQAAWTTAYIAGRLGE